MGDFEEFDTLRLAEEGLSPYQRPFEEFDTLRLAEEGLSPYQRPTAPNTPPPTPNDEDTWESEAEDCVGPMESPQSFSGAYVRGLLANKSPKMECGEGSLIAVARDGTASFVSTAKAPQGMPGMWSESLRRAVSMNMNEPVIAVSSDGVGHFVNDEKPLYPWLAPVGRSNVDDMPHE